MKKAAARVCFDISYSCALKRGMLEGSWCRITHLQGTEQACNPCLGRSPIDGFQFFCEAAAFVVKGKAGFWAQVESNSLPAVSWAMTLCVCTCCSLCGGSEIFQLMEVWANTGLFSQDSCFPQGLSRCQWSAVGEAMWSLIHNQFVMLSVPSGKASWNVPASEYSLVGPGFKIQHELSQDMYLFLSSN